MLFTQRRSSLRRGAATVETAIVGPVAALLVIAAIDLGRLCVYLQAAESTAYEAAKRATNLGATVDQVTDEAYARLATIGARDPGVFVHIEGIENTQRRATVRVEIPVGSNTWFFRRAGRVLEGEAVYSTAPR